MREIKVVEYRTDWPHAFAQEAKLLETTIGFLAPTIHHIGSTSVPGLAAKPIIDILLEVDDVSVLDAHDKHFETMGYEGFGEFGIPGRRYFQKGGDDRTHQIHAFKRGHIDATRHIAFRDYLIAHPDVAHAYAELKKTVARSCENDIERYCDGKDAFVKEHERLALQWYTGRRQQ